MRFVTRAALVAASLGCLAAGTADARSVSLSDARVAPDHIRVLKSGASASAGACRDEATDVQAYSGTGGALGQQQRVRSGWRWRGVGGYVLLRTDVQDGPARWVNRTTRPVLVAVWCS